MKTNLLHFLALILLMPLVVSCVDVEEFSNDNRGNFEALWKIIDEHYCFFAEKKQAMGVDWDEIHARYGAQVSDNMTSQQLFELCTKMLSELRDGHVNLISSWDYGRYWSWKENYDSNFSEDILRNYLGTDYRITCGLRYQILDDNIGYVYCPTFDTAFGDGNLDNILYYLSTCNGLILDIRNNGGGQLTSAEQLAERFLNEELLVGYIKHKEGISHDAFSTLYEQKLTPSLAMRWQKPVVLLTNRSVFSAANEFMKYMKAIGKAFGSVVILGDHSGGGAGLPFTSELPNGWGVRFSACPMYDAEGHSTEDGIAPDVYVSMSKSDAEKGIDTIIEEARRLLKK